MMRAYLVPHPPLIIPGIGKGDEIPGTRRAYERIAAEVSAFAPETTIFFTPHSILYRDYIHVSPGPSAHGDLRDFHAKGIRFSVDYDEELADLLARYAGEEGIPAGPLGERDARLDHGVMVPLHFLKSGRILRISLSGLSLIEHYRFGICLRRAIETLSRKTVVSASGDMSHKLKTDGPYGFAPDGPVHDAFVEECLRQSDFRKLMTIDPALCEGAAECGLRSIVLMAGVLDGLALSGEVLSYECPFGVGYLTAAFSGEGEAPSLLPLIRADRERVRKERMAREDAYVRLARENTERYVRSGQSIALPEGLPDDMLSRRAGVFVSIKKDGALRGCIGTIAPVERNIAAEILANSISAATRDSRFDPIAPEELDALSYSVDVLAPPEPVTGPEELDVHRYGVIVSQGQKRGLLLPNLEGVDTVEEQIDIALRKGGISAGAHYRLERFEVTRHQP
jgi:AmmeMemoRadiSam system protein A